MKRGRRRALPLPYTGSNGERVLTIGLGPHVFSGARESGEAQRSYPIKPPPGGATVLLTSILLSTLHDLAYRRVTGCGRVAKRELHGDSALLTPRESHSCLLILSSSLLLLAPGEARSEAPFRATYSSVMTAILTRFIIEVPPRAATSSSWSPRAADRDRAPSIPHPGACSSLTWPPCSIAASQWITR
jgi:hypothetical protein